MELTRRRRVTLILAIAFMLTGSATAEILARHQELFVKVMAPLWGSIAALSALSVLLAFARAVSGLLGGEQPAHRPPPDPDWRATARRNMVRMHRSGESMSRRAWLYALVPSVLIGGLTALSARDASTLIAIPFVWLIAFLIFRYEGKLFARMSPMPKDRESQAKPSVAPETEENGSGSPV